MWCDIYFWSVWSLMIIIYVTQAKDPHQCGLKYYVNKDSGYDNTECPSDLDQYLLTITEQYILSAKKMPKALEAKEIGGDFNFIHFGHKYYPQWLLSYYKERNVMFLYFQGTEMARLPEIMIDLDVTHKKYDFISDEDKDDKIRVSGSMTSVIDSAVEFRHMLGEDLKYIFNKYNIEGLKKKEMKFVISGTSLGAAYATWWYLGLYSEIKSYKQIRHKFVGEYFPSQLSKIWLITIGSPLIIFHQDVHKIPREIRARIFNIINGLDPIPMLAGGHNPLHIAGKNHIYQRDGGWKKLIRHREKRLELASNGAIGRYYILVDKKNKKSFLSKLNIFSKKKNEENVICSLQKMNSEAIKVHLNNGGHCVWDEKHLGASLKGVAWDFIKYHAKGYPEGLVKSKCIDKSILENIKDRKIFYINFCKAKTKDTLSKCYDYHHGEKKSGDDFIDPIENCKCYKTGGFLENFKTGYNML
eukprot:302402_1